MLKLQSVNVESAQRMSDTLQLVVQQSNNSRYQKLAKLALFGSKTTS